MSKYISLTAIGKDKPGLVEIISKVLYENHCNIEDSTMTILQGQFAMILILKMPNGLSVKKIKAELFKSSKSHNMTLSISPLKTLNTTKKRNTNPYIISVYGADKAGIVYEVSKFLALKKVNITDVQTTLSKSKGNKTYIMLVETQFPKNVSIDKVKNELQTLSKSLNVVVSINRANSSDI